MTKEYRGFPLPERGMLLLPFQPERSAVSAWLNELPIANVDRSTEMVLRALQSLSHHPLSAAQRLEFAELCRPCVCYLSGALEPHFLEAEYPLEGSLYAKMESSVWLHVELMNAYQRILEDKAFGEFVRADRARAIHRALFSAGRILLRISQAYEAPYAQFWNGVYRCYRLAERHELLDEAVQDKESDPGKASTVETMFKRLLVFAVCDLSCFRPREMRQIHDIAAQFSEYALLQKEAPPHTGNVVFAFNPHTDEPPRLRSLMGLEEKGETIYLLTRPVAEQITAHYLKSPLPQEGKIDRPSQAMLIRLINTLGAPVKRRYARMTEKSERTLVIGFKNLISALAGADKEVRQELEKRAEKEPKLDPRIAGQWRVPEFELVPMDDEFGSPPVRRPARHEVRSESAVDRLMSKRQPRRSKEAGIWSKKKREEIVLSREEVSDTGEVIDCSAVGYSFVWKSDKPGIKIGDVVGLCVENETRIEIGVIRRMSRSKEGELLFGVEILAPAAKLVGIAIPGHEESRAWAIFLAGAEAGKQPDTLLLPPSAYQPGEYVNLTREGQEVHCRLSQLLQSTAAFNHIALTYIKL